LDDARRFSIVYEEDYNADTVEDENKIKNKEL
jgi:hypothetical protein